MALQIVLQGTLKADGTLELAHRPPLPAGPVEVTLRPLGGGPDTGSDWWQYLQNARRELEAAGHAFRTPAEIDADLDDLRSSDERLEQLYSRPEDSTPEDRAS
jgi:hypothetical protein